MIADPSLARVTRDLEDMDLASGCEQGRWRIVAFAFPILDFAIRATEPDGTTTEYGFRAELSNYPAQAPLVRIWDHGSDTLLALNRRPVLPGRFHFTFQQWAEDTVYRPWERKTGPHGNNAATFPQLAWHPQRKLAFIFEDLHGILNKHARTVRLRSSA